MAQSGSPSSVLEIVKIIADVATPLIVLYFGHRATQAIGRIEQQNKVRERIAEDRMALYKEMGTQLNDIYCYIKLVGEFLKFTPTNIHERKSQADRTLNTYQPFFSDEFRTLYRDFMDLAFEPFAGGYGARAPINADLDEMKIEWDGANQHWDKTWDDSFNRKICKKEIVEIREEKIPGAYNNLLRQLAIDLRFLEPEA